MFKKKKSTPVNVIKKQTVNVHLLPAYTRCWFACLVDIGEIVDHCYLKIYFDKVAQ